MRSGYLQGSWLFLLILCLSASLLPATGVATEVDSGEGLATRVQAFWKARVAGDLVTMYRYEEASTSGKITLQDYVRKKGNMDYLSAKVLDIEPSNDPLTAWARVDIEAKIQGLPGTYKRIFRDRWVKLDDGWYHAPPPARLGS